MNQPIHASYTSSVSDAVDAFHFHWRTKLRPWARILGRLIGGLVLLLSIASLVTSAFSLRALVLLALSAYGLFILPFEMTRLYRKAYLAAPSANALISCSISADHIETTVGSLASATLAWPLVPKCLHTPCGFLLYTGPSSFLWLPFRAFASNADRLAAKALFESVIPKNPSVT
jgi:hypothetical protein